MTRLSLPLICECLLFVVPLNVYVIGSHLANGVQWALFRYQESSLGNSLILIQRDLSYVFSGILKGSSVPSTLIWALGTLLLLAALVMLVFAAVQHNPRLTKPAGLLTVAGGLLFFTAMLVQYGLTLANSHGFSVPVGVPLVLVTGVWLVYGEFGTDDDETGDEEGDTDCHDQECT